MIFLGFGGVLLFPVFVLVLFEDVGELDHGEEEKNEGVRAFLFRNRRTTKAVEAPNRRRVNHEVARKVLDLYR